MKRKDLRQPTVDPAWPEMDTPVRFGLLGDFHGRTKRRALDLFLREARPDILLAVGDLQDYEDWPIPTFFVRGNHENYTTIEAMDAGVYQPRNLFHLSDRTIVEISGLRIAGVGGIERTKPGPRALDPGAVDWIADQAGLGIVISHDSPIRFEHGDPERTIGSLRAAAELAAPRLWICGHHHYYAHEGIGRTDSQTDILSLGKYPHEWAIATWDGTDLSWEPFRPMRGYESQLPAWKVAEREDIPRLRSAGYQ